MGEEQFNIYYGGISKTKPDAVITLEEFYQLLKTKDPARLHLLQSIQNIKNSDPIVEKRLKNLLKKKLSYVTPVGTFSQRRNSGLIEMSGLSPIDIDMLASDQFAELRFKLTKDPFVALLFTSPSGKGLKVFIKVPKDKDSYRLYVQGFYEYLHKTYSTKDNPIVDIESLDLSAAVDLSRACYISYDADVYYNPDAQLFDTASDWKKSNAVDKTRDTSRSGLEYRELLKLLYAGVPEDEIFKHMTRFSKWIESGEQYQSHTWQKAKDYYDSHPPDANQKLSMVNILAQDILGEFHVAVIRSDNVRQEVYIYNNGIYQPEGKTYLAEFINERLGKYYTSALCEKIIEKVVVNNYVDADEFFKEEDSRFICVQNGILDMMDKTLKPFNPNFRFFNKLPITYNPEKTCEATIKHFQTILYEQDIQLMQELYGFMLIRDYKFAKAFIFSGDGGNGKTITLNQMRALLGTYNCVNISLHDLENHHFMKSQLHKKLANISDDIGEEKLTESRVFKELVGHAMITADRKHKTGVSFVNYAKMIFCANKIPLMADDSDGNWRRWAIIRFETSFLTKTEYDLKASRGELHDRHRLADVDIETKLVTEDELSGVLNWAIEGLHRLLNQKGFSYKKSMEETKKMMRRYSNNVMAFIHDCIEVIKEPDQYEHVADAYRCYIDYCFSRKRKVGKVESELHFRQLLEEELSLERKRTANGWEWRINYAKLKTIPEDV